MKIDHILQKYKTEAEIHAFVEAQQKTLLDTIKKNKELQEKVEHLEKLVGGVVPIIKVEGATSLNLDSDEEEIAKIEINKLKQIAMGNTALTLEEAKRLEIYTKILSSRTKKEDPNKNEREVKELNSNELLAVLESSEQK